jgi:hypothetical protein
MYTQKLQHFVAGRQAYSPLRTALCTAPLGNRTGRDQPPVARIDASAPEFGALASEPGLSETPRDTLP